ncbi:MAG TPA: VOC family protein [Holophagaceae bacterium]|jgi:extradiol dioxygenase family protein|nr:VOC family protein [Holophagaceae bacterium]
MTALFHHAFLVRDIAAARHFYGDLLSCREGRSAPAWVDFDFFGHQISLHLGEPAVSTTRGEVDGIQVPMPHFGAILDRDAFDALAKRLMDAGTTFVIAPRLRYEGQPAEQRTMFLLDPSGNALEFKAFRNPEHIF